MASVTHAEFGANTEGVEVTRAFADGVHGKTILVTGGNKNGLGFSAAHALVCTAKLLNSTPITNTLLGFPISKADYNHRSKRKQGSRVHRCYQEGLP